MPYAFGSAGQISIPTYVPVPGAGQSVSLSFDYTYVSPECPNDAVFKSDGWLYFTDPPYGLMGQDEVMIKPLVGMKPRGVAGATVSGEGVLVLVLELNELFEGVY